MSSSSSSASSLSSVASTARMAGQHDQVHKEECVFSFDTPESAGGLYVCLNRFLAFGRDHVETYHARTGQAVFLHIQRRKVPRAPAEAEAEAAETAPAEKVSRLALGIDGGFRPDEKKYSLETTHQIVKLPEYDFFSMDDRELPVPISLSAKSIIMAEDADRKEELSSAAASWDGELLTASKHADTLEQLPLPEGKKIPPRGWKCEQCDLTNNLWLNLTDGSILCGRKFFDGSGGNNHALEHYKEKKHPLAVKLGTITPDGKGDVFSYAEDNMVLDPHLAKHLSHFGIAISSLQKTDKSMVEIEIDMNQRIGEWATLTESGSKLEPIFGKGYTGMDNLGNTCYMNSIMQVLFTLPSFINAYVSKADDVFGQCNLSDPQDFQLQMCKLGAALWSDKYSKPLTDEEKKLEGNDELFQRGIKPTVFKNVVGKGHPDFSGKQQQDAQEFYLHLCNMIERQFSQGQANPVECLQFDVEDRIECGASGKVAYTSRIEDYLPLPIPMGAATNQAEVEAFKKKKADLEAQGSGETIPESEKVRPIIPFDACIQSFCEEERVDDFYSSATQCKTFAKKTMRLKTFPDYLLIQLKKFDIDDKWVPYKLDVEVQMPDEFDLTRLTAKGRQEGEQELPRDEQAKTPAVSSVIPDPSIVEQLAGMGFDVNGCKKAAFHTNNSGIEAAMNWVMQHMEDADFASPFVQPGAAQPSAAFVPNDDHLATLMGMGMARNKCVKALKETSNNVERAVDWIFSHPDDDGSDMDVDQSGAAAMDVDQSGAGAAAAGSSKSARLTNGVPKYRLKAFISHMGTSTMVGHYVCHILKEGRWVIYNDNKVALSEKPPKGLGYLYLYERQQE